MASIKTTLLEIVQVVQDVSSSDDEVVAVLATLMENGRIRSVAIPCATRKLAGRTTRRAKAHVDHILQAPTGSHRDRFHGTATAVATVGA